jgi:Zn-dependent M16 (insulinase) family peptidase
MMDTLMRASFDETDRIKELISQMRARRDQSISGAGHSLAMTAASAGMSPLASLYQSQSGLAGIASLRALDNALADSTALRHLSTELAELRDHLLSSPSANLLTVSDSQSLDQAAQALVGAVEPLANSERTSTWTPGEKQASTNQIWVANTQVNFCAKAYPTVSSGHPDAPALTVLGAYLRNGFLHRAIREQGGAYGGGASHDANVGAFRFFSYRDPRNIGTLADFDASIEWLLNSKADSHALEEAILSVVSSLDKPASPAGEVKKAFYDALYKRTLEQKRTLREAIINTRHEDLCRVANTYLKPELACSVILTDAKSAEGESLSSLGWQHHDVS